MGRVRGSSFARLLSIVAVALVAPSPASPAPSLAGITAPASPAKPATPQPVAPGDVPVRADTDERFVQEVVARAAQRDPSQKLGPQLDQLSAGVRRLQELTKADDLRTLPAMRLESLDRHWVFYDTQLDLWRAELQRASTRYSDDAADLTRRRGVWEATRDQAGPGGLAPALQDRIQTVLAEITAAEQAVSGPLDNQFRLNSRANDLQSSIDSGRRSVEEAIAYYDRRLRMIDSPTLPELWREPGTAMPETGRNAFSRGVELDFLREYFAANGDRARAHAVFAVLLLPLLIWLSRRSRKLVADEPRLEASARILLRPISSWLVLVLVGTLVFEPDAPLVLHHVSLLAALIPVLRLLPREVFNLLGPWPYVVTALYVAERLGVLLVAHPLWYRLHLLVIALLALLPIVWLLVRAARRTPAAGIKEPPLYGVLRGAGLLAAMALIVAAVSNFWGNVTLAEMLTRATVTSGYVGLALYAGASVLIAVLRLLAARRELVRFRSVTQHTGPLLRSFDKLIRLAALVIWLAVTMSGFRIYRPIADVARRVLTYPIEIGQISITLGSVLLFIGSVWVAFWLARTIRAVLNEEVLPKMSLPRGVGNSVSTLSYYALVTIGVLIALAASGFQLSQLAIVVGALSVGIGFGLQNVVNNFVSGLILMFERPIQPGDIVEVSGVSGKVGEIGMRATKMKTFEGADVVVPNGMLLSEKLVNWTLSDMNRRIDVNLGVAYGSDPKQVLELLMVVTRSTPGVATDPAPTVFFTGFGASSLDFSIRAWTNNFGDWVAIRSELNVRLYDALNTAGIEIPFPQQDIHLRSVAPEARDALAAVRPATP